jgi:hypothetical protein
MSRRKKKYPTAQIESVIDEIPAALARREQATFDPPPLSNEPMQRALQLQKMMMDECRRAQPHRDPFVASWEWWKRAHRDMRELNEIMAGMMPEISRHFVPIQLQIGQQTIQTWAPIDALQQAQASGVKL